MEVAPILAFKIFVSATATAGLLNMYIVQQLKGYSIEFHSGRFIDQNLKWARSLPTVRWLIGDSTISYMKSRTLFFPAFELIFGTLVVVSLYRHGLGAGFLRSVIFFVVAIPLAMISWQDTVSASAPDVITYPGMVAGILAGIILGPPDLVLPQVLIQFLTKTIPSTATLWLSIINSLLGVLVGGGSLWLMGWIWERLRGFEAMGLGAVKTGMMIGAFCGWRLAVLMLFVAVFIGSLSGVAVMIRRRDRDPRMLLPFVPFLVLGGIVALLWGNAIVPWYVSQLQRN